MYLWHWNDRKKRADETKIANDKRRGKEYRNKNERNYIGQLPTARKTPTA